MPTDMPADMRAERFDANPIITPNMDDRMGENINGPSLIRAPEWLPSPLGRYYLYFAHHHGTYIRLAYADDLAGPWRMHRPGVLDLADTPCSGHIASPDVHVDDDASEFRMYFHGTPPKPQTSYVALSDDGLTFRARPEALGPFYFRVWRRRGWHYAIGRRGCLWRSRDGLTAFEEGPRLIEQGVRHTAVLVESDEALTVFYSRVGDTPEHIVAAPVDCRGDWTAWRAGPAESILLPEEEYEGAKLPLAASRAGWAKEPVRQLRDPAVFREDGQVYLVYSIAGESGLAIARVS